jgi:hypothetical protein
VERAAQRNAADKDTLDAERAALQSLVPGAAIWYVEQFGGVVRWIAHLEANTAQHLLEGLRDAGNDAEAGL